MKWFKRSGLLSRCAGRRLKPDDYIRCPIQVFNSINVNFDAQEYLTDVDFTPLLWIIGYVLAD